MSTAVFGGGGPVAPPIAPNYSTAFSDSFQPRALVVIAGDEFYPISCEITENAHGVLDTAECTLSISGNKDLSLAFQSQLNDGSILGEIHIGFPANAATATISANQLFTRFFGIVDTIEPDFGKNEAKVTFRSLGALLELKKQTHNTTQTTVALVQAVCAAVGLKANIKLQAGQVPATLGMVAGADLQVGIQNQRLWDTLVNCAEVDDVDVWVSGNTLNYVASNDITRNHVYLKYGHDFIDFTGTHSPQFNKNIHVEVRTWNKKQRFAHTVRYTQNADGSPPTVAESTRTVTSEAIFGTNGALSQASSYDPLTGNTSSSATTSSSTGGSFNTGNVGIPRDTSGERIIIRRPGLTAAQANSLAQTTLNRITRNEYAATFTVIPTPSTFANLTIESVYVTSGVPYYKWNSSTQWPAFSPRRITTRFEGPSSTSSAGLKMEIEAVNHLPFAGTQ